MASTPKFYDRVKESTTTTGTGTLTLAGAVTGFLAFSTLGNGNSCWYTIQAVDASGNPSGAWEVGVGTYTSAGTTLSRDIVVASSNSNAAVNFAAGTKHVWIDFPAAIAEPAAVAQGRLTTESGVPVSTSDRTAQGTIYWTPYRGNLVDLWNGSGWQRYRFAQVSLALTATSGKNYDVFLYDNSGTLTLELSAAWTNDTTRADAIANQDGVPCKSGALTRRWLGTIRASGANVTADSGGGTTTQVGGQRFVWNAYNQVPRPLAVIDTTDSWSYTTNTVRQANAASGNKVEYVTGDAALLVRASVLVAVYLSNSGAAAASVGVGVDSTTAYSGLVIAGYVSTVATAVQMVVRGSYLGYPGLGYHALNWCEDGGGGTSSFQGDAGDPGVEQSGLQAEILG